MLRVVHSFHAVATVCKLWVLGEAAKIPSLTGNTSPSSLSFFRAKRRPNYAASGCDDGNSGGSGTDPVQSF
jgi:hypothetical protein